MMNNSKKKNRLIYSVLCAISILFCLIGLSGIFLSGSLNSNSALERNADYITNVVNKGTFGSKYCAVSVDAPNEKATYYEKEFTNLFDVFHSHSVSFFPAMNVNKELDIRLESLDSDNISLFYLGPIGTKIDPNNNSIRHNLYNIEMMFEDPVYKGTEYDKNHASIATISVEQANKYLELLNEPRTFNRSYEKEQYKKLIKQPISININGVQHTYYIWNIYFNNGFFCDGLKEVLGEFVLTSYYQPTIENLSLNYWLKCVYAFNNSSYYNKYLIKYLEDRYIDSKPNMKVVRNNIICDFDESVFLKFYYPDITEQKFNPFSILIIASSSFVLSSFVIFLVLNGVRRAKQPLVYSILYFSNMFIPYLFFKIVYIITGDPLFFSEFSCKLNAIYLMGTILVFVLFYLTSINKKKGLYKSKTYEISL